MKAGHRKESLDAGPPSVLCLLSQPPSPPPTRTRTPRDGAVRPIERWAGCGLRDTPGPHEGARFAAPSGTPLRPLRALRLARPGIKKTGADPEPGWPRRHDASG